MEVIESALQALGGGVLATVTFFFTVFVTLMWLFLPFALYGIKPILRKIHETQAQIHNQMLRDRISEMRKEIHHPDCKL